MTRYSLTFRPSSSVREAIRVHSERSFEAATKVAEPEIRYRETEDLRRSIADVAAARDATARKLDELEVALTRV
jgi:hypothetical protein